ncbi:MAG: hypothetical protein ABL995_17960 [Bryobacteraceae bacterium]
MAGFLDQYGVDDARKERKVKRLVLSIIAVLILGAAAFFFFRNFPEERLVKQFFSLLKEKKYQDAYALWGCTAQTPCRYYGPERFNEDWGPDGLYKNPDALKLNVVDACGDGPLGEAVVFGYSYPGVEDFGLQVDRKTKFIGFAPSARCPGRHLAIGDFLRSRFGMGGDSK